MAEQSLFCGEPSTENVKTASVKPKYPTPTSRRSFLKNLTGAAAATLATSSVEKAAAGPLPPAQGMADARERSTESFLMRLQAARQERETPIPLQDANGDEDLYANFIGNFSKGLPHNSTGEVDVAAYQMLLDALGSGTSAAFENIPLGGNTPIVNPLAGLAFDLEGADSHQLAIPPAPPVASQARADEMVELYWMALVRDISFTDYPTNPIAQAAASELSSLATFTGPRAGGQVTAQTLFRGFTAEDVVGPYVSQLFQIPFVYGQFALSGKVSTYVPGIDYLTSETDWIACRNGQGPFTNNQLDPQVRYYRNGRDLSAYVHADHICEAYYNATLRLFSMGAPLNPGNPYTKLNNQGPFTTFGSPHFLAMHGEFALRALKTVWFAKWFVHRTLRPEAYGGLVHMTKTGQASYPLHSDVLNSKAADQTAARYGTHFLSSAFPEGCPQHPSHAQAHGAISGACATILKVAFDGSVQFNTLKNGAIVVASGDGLSLVPYTGSDANEITVNGEINKIASNIGLARNFANMHWRTDYVEGLKLGEAVAIRILRDQKNLYSGEDFSGFQIVKFDGTNVTV